MITPEMVAAELDGYIAAGLARRAETGNVVVPKTAMITPDNEPRPVVSVPAIRRKPPVAGPPARLCDIQFCLYGEDVPISITGTNVKLAMNGESRVDVLQGLRDANADWIVWLENGAELTYNWLSELTAQMTQPAVLGRTHRSSGGDLYPYPAFFAVHRSLLKKADSFIESFDVEAGQFKLADQIVRLPTTARAP